MNVVLFLGAGYSAPFGLPIMNDFLSFADSSTKLNNEDKDFIGRLVLEARRANSFLESSPTNLEDILSFSVMADRLSLNENESSTHNYKLREILQKIFTQVNETKGFWKRYDILKSFLSFNPGDERSFDISIITTNYDLSIECSLIQLGLRTNTHCPILQIQDKADLNVNGNLYSKDGGIPVLKLHGSVNWYEMDGGSNAFDVEGRLVGVQGEFYSGEFKSLPYVCTNGYKYIKPPSIIPPSFLKPDLKGPLGEIWKVAAEKLKNANILVFVGYSFPLTDTEMMYFLARSLTDNANLRKILLIDPYADRILDKINSKESKFGSHFRNLLEIEKNNWEQTSLKQYLK